jgi:hypothetical protein
MIEIHQYVEYHYGGGIPGEVGNFRIIVTADDIRWLMSRILPVGSSRIFSVINSSECRTSYSPFAFMSFCRSAIDAVCWISVMIFYQEMGRAI